jgi:hypothetical protein
MPTYGWLTKTQAIEALQGRLYNAGFWPTAAELWSYLVEGLRHWNALTEQWNVDFPIANANGAWINTGILAGSPRLRTQTDVGLYTQMEYMLLEPPSGGTWTGTNQFSIAALQYALQKRTQEVIQATACNLTQLSPLATTPGTRRSLLPDTVLEPRRIRFLALMADTTATGASGAFVVTVPSTAGIAFGQQVDTANVPRGTFVTAIVGNVVNLSQATTGVLAAAPIQFSQPISLTREDTDAFNWFEPSYLQTNALSQSWSLASEPPLAFDVDNAPNVPGTYDILALQSGPAFAPPAASLLGVPDDWSMVPMYGALADLLGRESESTDRARAAYCLQRYTMGLEAMRNSNWFLQAQINGQASDTPSLQEMDDYATGWQSSNGNLPAVVNAGMDLVAPVPGVGQAATLTLLGNAPLLDTTGTYVQVSRDDFVAILNYAQHVACFKQGGAEFMATTPLLKDFYRAAVAYNKRILDMGIFADMLRAEGKRQEVVDPR